MPGGAERSGAGLLTLAARREASFCIWLMVGGWAGSVEVTAGRPPQTQWQAQTHEQQNVAAAGRIIGQQCPLHASAQPPMRTLLLWRSPLSVRLPAHHLLSFARAPAQRTGLQLSPALQGLSGRPGCRSFGACSSCQHELAPQALICAGCKRVQLPGSAAPNYFLLLGM
jgi:hypothetical protein